MNYQCLFSDFLNKNIFLSIMSREAQYKVKIIDKGPEEVLLIDVPLDIIWKIQSMIKDEYPLFNAKIILH